MELKRVAITPQQVHVAVPPLLLLDVIRNLDHGSRVGSGSLGLISQTVQRMVVAFTAGPISQQGEMIKEMIAYPPDRITYRHLSGPFTGAEEELRLLPSGTGTDLRFTAHFDAPPESPIRLLKLSLEYATLERLQTIKDEAEMRIGMLANGAGHVEPAMAGVCMPQITSERALLEAVEAQEESEWGHVGHGRGVERVAVSLAEAVMLPERQMHPLRRAALLHDAGKIAVDPSLWGLRGTLTPAQRSLMEVHPRLGHDLATRAGLPAQVQVAILHHHERWDGQGYPDGLVGDQIPLKARILFLAEAIDSMLRATYRRPTMSTEQVVATLHNGAGRLWDPILARKAARIIHGK